MERNTKILTGIIVLLILLNLSIVATLFYNKNEVTNYGVQDNQEIEMPTNHLGRFFREALNLSNEQHRAFQNIRHQYHENSDIIIEKMDKNRNDLLTALGAEKSDTIILKKLSKDIGSLHTELKNLTIQYYLDMKEVCNEKQKVKLFQTFKAMVNSNDIISMPEEKNYKNN
ncbi:Spy/CpxP family protein refolding chaperone [Aureibaculum luteum]|uniref:Spy/CpxP family protein refolding chaperone n=1 Tax=Aureibaculum luteum TaxID=1548456 RepID=UPI000E4C0794|nr:periplasmic heavy metal sensor [Aureibaculum luteum]